jgi:hypothetical protein
MLAMSEQAVQHCLHSASSLLLEIHQQDAQQCPFETLSLESCQRALESSWRHLRGLLRVWQEPKFLRVLLSIVIGS